MANCKTCNEKPIYGKPPAIVPYKATQGTVVGGSCGDVTSTPMEELPEPKKTGPCEGNPSVACTPDQSQGGGAPPVPWNLLKRVTSCLSGRMLVFRNCFLHWLRPECSGPIQFNANTGEVYGGPMTEVAQVVDENIVLEQGYLTLGRTEKRIINGHEVLVLVHGVQQLKYLGEGHLMVAQIDQGGVRIDRLVPEEKSAPGEGARVLAMRKEDREDGCSKKTIYESLPWPTDFSAADLLTIDDSNSSKIRIPIYRENDSGTLEPKLATLENVQEFINPSS